FPEPHFYVCIALLEGCVLRNTLGNLRRCMWGRGWFGGNYLLNCRDCGIRTVQITPMTATPANIPNAQVGPKPAPIIRPVAIGPTLPPRRPKPAHQATPAARAEVTK